MRTLPALLLLTACATTSSPALESVLAWHTVARGGAAAIEAVENMRVKISVKEPQFTVDGTYVADRKGRMRIDIFAEGRRVYSEGIDERGAWQMGESGGPAASSAEGAAALEHGRLFNLYGLHELSGLGHELTLEAPVTSGGRTHDRLRIRLADGFETWRLIDRSTGMISAHRDFRALHPDVDPKPVWLETRFADFRRVSGVLVPFSSEQRNLENGQWLQSTEVRSIELNTTLTDSDLRPPE